ncbi:ankyrin repeat-containing protein BDA1-like [Alnus glutinosa]|uniref:ankyrin repeat-containing protein BDA1-like n=1 Tax=Alnus glutinosa TaxID=3517 RepID=UPI002D77F5E8|nr:ankyrin repeat-containing protein BDA1-like [Alnus glutinosa]
MDQSLRDVAQQGSIDALYELIQGNPNVLDRIDDIPFVETPLHTAAFAGHTWFAMEIMRLKPSFARKLNQDGLTPLHLALRKLRALDQVLLENEPNDGQVLLEIEPNDGQVLLENEPNDGQVLLENEPNDGQALLENEPNDGQVLLENESNDGQALHMNQTQLVYRLVLADKDLVRVQGREGMTPLHEVARIGNLDILSKFLEVCPTSIEDVTIGGETVLHIALKNNHGHAFEYLLRWLQWTRIEDASFSVKKLLDWKDKEDNTVLHIAVSKFNNQPAEGPGPSWFQVVRLLLDAGVRGNSKNLRGSTAFDILQVQMQVNNNEMIRMKDMLCRARALSASSLPTVKSYEAFLQSHRPVDTTLRRLYTSMYREHKMTNELRSMFMVVVVLFITATYQAALSPPGGVWQDNYNPPTDQFNSTSAINVTSELSPTPHKAGTVTMNKKYFWALGVVNTFCFASAFAMIPVLLPFNIFSFFCMLSMVFLYLSYVISLSVIDPSRSNSWF